MAATLVSRARYSPSFVRPVCGLRLTRARFSFATNSTFLPSRSIQSDFSRQIIFACMDNLHIYVSKTIRFDRKHRFLFYREEHAQPPIIPIEKLAEAEKKAAGRDAIAFCRTNDGPISRVEGKGLDRGGRGSVDNSKGTRDPRGKWKKSEA